MIGISVLSVLRISRSDDVGAIGVNVSCECGECRR